MTNSTDIKALREAALKATKGEWRAFTDIRTGTCAVHTPEDKSCGDIVDWPGFDGAEGSKKQKVANAKYIALANPQTIIALLDQLEGARAKGDLWFGKVADLEAALKAERQRAGELQSTINRLSKSRNKLFDDRQRINKSWTEAETDNALLRDEIAALKAKLDNPVKLSGGSLKSDGNFWYKDKTIIKILNNHGLKVKP